MACGGLPSSLRNDTARRAPPSTPARRSSSHDLRRKSWARRLPGIRFPQFEDSDRVHAVEEFRRAASAGGLHPPESAHSARAAQPRDLQPCRRPARRELPLQEELLRLFAPQLAAGCFWDAARRDQLDAVRREAQPAAHLFRDRRGNYGAPRAVALAALGHDDQLFRAGGFIAHAKRNDASLAHAFGARSQLLDFVRIKIPARLDDDVFHAASDENFALGAICAVAGVHPRVFALPDGWALRKQLFCRPRIPVVAARRRRPAEPQITFHALRRFLSGIVHDADFVARNGRAGGHKRDGGRVIRCGWDGAARAGEDFTLDAIDAWTPAERRNRDRQG